MPGVDPTIEGQRTDTRVVAEAALHRKLTDGEVSAYFSRLAWTWIRQHPMTWLRLFGRKVFYLLNAQHTALPLSYPFYAYDARTLLRFLFVGQWVLAPLGLVGLAVGWQRTPASQRADYLIWLTFVPAYAFAVVMFFVAERYRLPLLVPYAVGAGVTIDALLRRVTARPVPIRPLIVVSVCVITLGVVVNWPLHIRDGDARSEERVHMAENVALLGRVDEAEHWLNLALPTNTNPGMAHYRVGMGFLDSSQWEPAITELTEALAARPGEPHAEFALGEALANSGRVKEAIPHLERAVAADRDVELAGYDLAVAFMEVGNFKAAAETLRNVRPPATADASVWLDLGHLALKVQAPDVGEPFLRRAAQLAPASGTTHGALGVCLIMEHKYDEARRQLATSIQLDPKNADSTANLAYAEFELGLIADARAHDGLALHLNPGSSLAQQLQSTLARIK